MPDKNTEYLIDISTFDKADVLAALYNASKPLGMGFLNYDPTPMDKVEAKEYIEQHTRKFSDGTISCYFDYLKGRVMKVDLGGKYLDPRLYDRDNGPGAAERAIAKLTMPTITF